MKIKSILGALCSFVLLLSGITPSYAATGGMETPAREEYTYTVRFLAGAQGTIGGGPALVIQDLAYGDVVSFSPDMVTVTDSDKYYVKGIREAGKDNSTVSESSFVVTGDADYVVAYGIKSNTVAYTVNYQDEAGNPLNPDDGYGNKLASSVTYYGNVGDRVIVAFRQVDGYMPQAYNVARTLSEDPGANVFTFVYSPIRSGANSPDTPVTDEAPSDIEADSVPQGDGPTHVIDLDESKAPAGILDIGQHLFENGAHLFSDLPFMARMGLITINLVAIFFVLRYIILRKKRSSNA